MSRLGADPTWKAMWRLIRNWVCHNHKVYYTVSICWAVGVYQFWWHTLVGYYRQRNYHRSLDFAIQKEREWEINKPKEEEYDDEEEEEDGGDGGDAGAEAAEAPAEGGDDEEDE